MIRPRSVLLREWEVRAIQEGRLTMLARPVNPEKGCTIWAVEEEYDNDEQVELLSLGAPGGPTDILCPFGMEGDVLLGKETWGFSARVTTDAHDRFMREMDSQYLVFRADGSRAAFWHPPQRMPQWAVRIRLRVESVACKRVQEITEEVAYAQAPGKAWGGGCFHRSWAGLWDADNPRHPWEENPWTWIARVGRVTP